MSFMETIFPSNQEKKKDNRWKETLVFNYVVVLNVNTFCTCYKVKTICISLCALVFAAETSA